MNRLADAKREIAIDLLWVKVGAKEVVPNWKKHRKITVVVCGILTVVNVMKARGNDYPLQPSISPPDIQMHEIIWDGIL
jgi:hypothetical protein